MKMRDPVTGILGKRSKVRMNKTTTNLLEEEYQKLLTSTNKKKIWSKMDLKRLSRELNLEEAKIYKWCWERSRQDRFEDEEKSDKSQDLKLRKTLSGKVSRKTSSGTKDRSEDVQIPKS